MKITALSENTSVSPKLKTEHGLSLWINACGKNILFDMGQSSVFAENAETLGIDLRKADLAVLSHGHYDHGGGLEIFREINPEAPVYLSRHALDPHFNAVGKDIGLSPAVAECTGLHFTGDVTVLGEGLTLYSGNDREKRYAMPASGMTAQVDGVSCPDDFRHEQYLLIQEGETRVLITGCSHKGILDLVEWFCPDVLIGGFHFFKLPVDDRLAEYAELLNRQKTVYHTCHCTGEAQYAYLKERMDRLAYLACGQSITI